MSSAPRLASSQELQPVCPSPATTSNLRRNVARVSSLIKAFLVALGSATVVFDDGKCGSCLTTWKVLRRQVPGPDRFLQHPLESFAGQISQGFSASGAFDFARPGEEPQRKGHCEALLKSSAKHKGPRLLVCFLRTVGPQAVGLVVCQIPTARHTERDASCLASRRTMP